MSDALCDTSILIRLITGDDADKQDRAIALFEQVEQGKRTLIPVTHSALQHTGKGEAA